MPDLQSFCFPSHVLLGKPMCSQYAVGKIENVKILSLLLQRPRKSAWCWYGHIHPQECGPPGSCIDKHCPQGQVACSIPLPQLWRVPPDGWHLRLKLWHHTPWHQGHVTELHLVLCCFLRISQTCLMRTSGRRLGNRKIYSADERGEAVFFPESYHKQKMWPRVNWSFLASSALGTHSH